jgi:hypothetical protein
MPIVIDPRGLAEHGRSPIDDCPDPLWSIYIRELSEMVRRLNGCADEPWTDRVYDLSQSVCESSRSLLYKVDYLTVPAAEKLAALFREAAEAIEQAADRPEAGKRQPLMRGFADHVRHRADLLNERVAAVRPQE